MELMILDVLNAASLWSFWCMVIKIGQVEAE